MSHDNTVVGCYVAATLIVLAAVYVLVGMIAMH